MSFNFRSNFSGKYQVNTYYSIYPVDTLPGIYQVFTLVFTWVFTSFASQFGIYLGIYPGKCPDKYPECIYLKAFTLSLLTNLRNFTKFLENSNQNR